MMQDPDYGYIYVLSSPVSSGTKYTKIGYSNNIYGRLLSHSKSSSAPFLWATYRIWQTEYQAEARQLEREVKKLLNGHRSPGKEEIFELCHSKVIGAVKAVSDKFDIKLVPMPPARGELVDHFVRRFEQCPPEAFTLMTDSEREAYIAGAVQSVALLCECLDRIGLSLNQYVFENKVQDHANHYPPIALAIEEMIEHSSHNYLRDRTRGRANECFKKDRKSLRELREED